MEESEFSLEAQYLDDEKRWMASSGLDKDTLCGAVETVVFLSERPLSVKKIGACVGEEVPVEAIKEALACLQETYAAKTHGLELVHVAKGWQFRTKADFAKYAQGLFKAGATLLSPTAMEVLAIIAYRQPISKTQIDEIRGVDSSYVVRGLMDKRLVKTIGRSDEIGRPTLYGTTPEFLELFNLSDIDQLPAEHELQELASSEGVGSISDIKNLVLSGEENPFFFDEIEELDRLGEQIKEVSADTDFTKALGALKKKGADDAPKKSAFDILSEYVEPAPSGDAAEEGISLAGLSGVPGKLPEEELAAGDEVEEREGALERLTRQMTQSAKELDLDLDLLREEEPRGE